MKYLIHITIPTVVEVEADSESTAIKKVYDELVRQKQILPTNPVSLTVVEIVQEVTEGKN